MLASVRSQLRGPIAVAAAAALLAGCGGNPAADVTTAPDDDAAETSPESSGATDATDDTTVDASTEVTVTLTEFAIAMSRSSFAPGVAYTFTIVNDGDAAHEMLVLDAQDAGTSGMGGMDHGSGHDDHQDSAEMQAMHEAAVVSITESELPAGATVTRTVRFDEAAELEFACHLPGHYEAGMLSSGTVTAS